jgi:hypothetical protein
LVYVLGGAPPKHEPWFPVHRPNQFRPAWAVRGYRPIVASSSKWQKFWRDPPIIQPDPPETQPLEKRDWWFELTPILISVLVIAVIVLSVLVWRMNNRIECLEQTAGVSASPYTVSYHSHSC